mmetsp:Transcript_69904/g.194412  ORF Transcript_69904/g.194412 Transcript_69904/m.194412 type:complete len:210 (+) Transcript_69904:1109-1738(+)
MQGRRCWCITDRRHSTLRRRPIRGPRLGLRAPGNGLRRSGSTVGNDSVKVAIHEVKLTIGSLSNCVARRDPISVAVQSADGTTVRLVERLVAVAVRGSLPAPPTVAGNAAASAAFSPELPWVSRRPPCTIRGPGAISWSGHGRNPRGRVSHGQVGRFVLCVFQVDVLVHVVLGCTPLAAVTFASRNRVAIVVVHGFTAHVMPVLVQVPG